MPHKPDTPCSRCGTLLWRTKTSRPADQMICRPCRRVQSTPTKRQHRDCPECGRMFLPDKPRVRTCSRSCGRKASPTRGTGAKTTRTCIECGTTFEAVSANYCSPRCRGDYRQGKTGSTHRRRARRFGVQYTYFDAAEVFERDGWVCQLCTQPVDRELRYPDPDCASLDHIVPMSLGGPHTVGNTQLAHLSCNLAKGAALDLAEVTA